MGEVPAQSYYRARYYDPSAGRFASEDPVGFDGGANFYSYVGNNATNFNDPLGLFSLDKSCGCGWDRDALKRAQGLAQAAAVKITDSGLRGCILNKLNSGQVNCGGKICKKGSKPDKKGRVLDGWGIPGSNAIHVCKPAFANDNFLACIVIHEFAHTCGHPFEGKPDQAANQAFPGVCN